MKRIFSNRMTTNSSPNNMKYKIKTAGLGNINFREEMQMTTQEYYHLKTQLTQKWGLNLDQIQNILTKYKMRVWVYLPQAKIFEASIKMLTTDDFSALRYSFHRSSNKKLTALGVVLQT